MSEAKISEAALILDRYDTGLLGDGGGGDVNWWWDYIRSEFDRAHEFYQDQADNLHPQPAELDEQQGVYIGMPVGERTVARAMASLDQSLTFAQDFRAEDVRIVLSALAATGKQQVGELHGDAWTIAELVRTDLDRQTCPDHYMRVAVESVVKHVEAWQASLAARQPGAQEPIGRVEADADASTGTRVYWNQVTPPVGTQLYAAPTAQAGEVMRSDLSGYAMAASQVRRGYDVECDRCGKFCDTGPGPCRQVGEVQAKEVQPVAHSDSQWIK